MNRRVERTRSSRRRGIPNRRLPPDGIAVLKAEHVQVERWFKEFERARTGAHKRALVMRICAALEVHSKVEENSRSRRSHWHRTRHDACGADQRAADHHEQDSRGKERMVALITPAEPEALARLMS
jgi:hypothetical protein